MTREQKELMKKEKFQRLHKMFILVSDCFYLGQSKGIVITETPPPLTPFDNYIALEATINYMLIKFMKDKGDERYKECNKFYYEPKWYRPDLTGVSLHELMYFCSPQGYKNLSDEEKEKCWK
jgi:hypothetical protein